MTAAARKFEIVDGGCSITPLTVIEQPIEQPLHNLEKWVGVDVLAALASVSPQAAQKALAAGRWRGVDLQVRRVDVGRGGAGGMAPQVHVDSLPADLRTAWYLGHGIRLHDRVEPGTGRVVQVPESAAQNDPKWDHRVAVARWRLDVIRAAVSHPKGSAARKAALDAVAGQIVTGPDGKQKVLSRSTLYNWVAAYDAGGLNGLITEQRSDKGISKAVVTIAWDQFFKGLIGDGDHQQVAEELTKYIRSLWSNGAAGWRVISEMSTTRLIELSHDLRVPEFEALPKGRLVDAAGAASHFGVCSVSGRRVRDESSYQVLAIRDKDNARFMDTIAPTIRRDYSLLKPREIVVGDVHPMDIMVVRPDGSTAYPKAISWFDPATGEIHMTIVLLEKGEGVRREHIAMAFEAMVAEWGLPKLLYLDNGSEYGDRAVIDGFTHLSKLVGLTVRESSLVDDRVRIGREAVVRSLPYNAKGKPGIEGLFGNLEQVFLSHVKGWTAGERMRKKTHAKGRDPIPFPGTMVELVETVRLHLDHYHRRPARVNRESPNEKLRRHIEAGWGKVVLENPRVLALAFSEKHTRTVDRGVVAFAPRGGRSQGYYLKALLEQKYHGKEITIRVPAYDPQYLFCFDENDDLIGIAEPEKAYHPMDLAGAIEGAARTKFLRRHLREQSRHCALLDLTAEAARHLGHLPEAPEVPVAAVINTGMLDRMADAEAAERAARADAAAQPRRKLTQWETRPNALLAAVEYEDDEA